MGLADIVGGTLRGVGAGITAGAQMAVQMEGERLRNAFLEKQLQARERMHGENLASRERISNTNAYLRQEDIDNRKGYYDASLDERRRTRQQREEEMRGRREATQNKLYDDMTGRLEERDFKERKERNVMTGRLEERDFEERKERNVMTRHRETLQSRKEVAEMKQGKGETKTGLTDNQTLSFLIKKNTVEQREDPNNEWSPVVRRTDWDQVTTEYEKHTGYSLAVEDAQKAAAEMEDKPEAPSSEAETPAPAGDTVNQIKYGDLLRKARERGQPIKDIVKLAQSRGYVILGLPDDWEKPGGGITLR